MNSSRVMRFDWNGPMQQIAPFISHQGGVIVITGFPTSACNTFAELVRGAIKGGKTQGICVKLDPDDETTRYPQGILAKLEQKLSIQDAPPINILNDNEVGGNMDVSGVVINDMPDPMRNERRNLRRVEKLIAKIKEEQSKRRIAIMLHSYGKMPHQTVAWFWNQLWDEGLEECVEQGLLVLCSYETPDGDAPGTDLIPAMNAIIQLPAYYEQGERAQVLEEVTQYIIKVAQIPEFEARNEARLLLNYWDYRPSKLHGGLMGAALKLVKLKS